MQGYNSLCLDMNYKRYIQTIDYDHPLILNYQWENCQKRSICWGLLYFFSSGHFDIMITKWLNVEQEIKNKDMTAGSALETWKIILPTYYIKTKDLILRWSCTKFSTGSPPTWLFCQQETKWQRKEKERKERTIIYLSTQLQIYMTRLYFSISNPDSFPCLTSFPGCPLSCIIKHYNDVSPSTYLCWFVHPHIYSINIFWTYMCVHVDQRSLSVITQNSKPLSLTKLANWWDFIPVLVGPGSNLVLSVSPCLNSHTRTAWSPSKADLKSILHHGTL